MNQTRATTSIKVALIRASGGGQQCQLRACEPPTDDQHTFIGLQRGRATKRVDILRQIPGVSETVWQVHTGLRLTGLAHPGWDTVGAVTQSLSSLCEKRRHAWTG